MGLVGGLLALSWRGFGRRHPVTKMWIQYSAVGFVLPIVSNLLGASIIDNAAHFGGWLAGIGVALAFAGRRPLSARANVLVATSSGLLVAGSFAVSLALGGGASELVAASVPASLLAAQKAVDAEDWPAADQALARAILEEPRELRIRLVRAQVLDHLDRRDDARSMLVSATDLVANADPADAGNLAQMLLEHDAPKPARKAAAIAQYKDPGNPRWKEIYDRAVAADK
jgi:hypothetical protein